MPSLPLLEHHWLAETLLSTCSTCTVHGPGWLVGAGIEGPCAPYVVRITTGVLGISETGAAILG